VAEVGRQPWVVYGLQRTATADSTNVTPAMTYFTLLGFMGLYLVVGLLYLMLFYRIIEQGPDTASADAAIGALGTGGATAAARSAP
jgi:cytochrome bd ubiquinol oxidase subunit I